MAAVEEHSRIPEHWQVFLKRNEKFAETHKSSPEFKSFVAQKSAAVVVTCMDPRVIPEEYLDFGEMEMAVIRNAGGRAPDAMRSLRCLDAISGFGTGHLDLVVVIHHTDCGLTNFDNEFIENRVKENAPEKHKHEIDGFDFGEIKNIDEAVRDDVAYIKRDQFIPKDVLVLGYVYDVFSGKLREVK